MKSTRADADLPRATLGTRRETPFTYEPTLLEAIPVAAGPRATEQHRWVTLQALRFSSLCPVTGSPDWAELTINYVPNQQLVESKSLKEYLQSFRMHGDFHEDVCRLVCDDLVACIGPRYLEVAGCFDSRGSVAIWPYVQFARSGDGWAERLREHRALHYVPGAWTPARPVR